MRSLVLQRALETWQAGICDPAAGDESSDAQRNRAEILNMIGPGGLGWQGWVKTYRGNGAFAWCGAFAAWCWAPLLPPKTRFQAFASTYRLYDWGRKDARRRLTAFSEIQPSDVVTVGDGPWGSHIVVALAWDKSKSSLVTVEGNAHGRFPDGTWGEGVVLNVRPRSDLRAAYRPLDADLETQP